MCRLHRTNGRITTEWNYGGVLTRPRTTGCSPSAKEVAEFPRRKERGTKFQRSKMSSRCPSYYGCAFSSALKRQTEASWSIYRQPYHAIGYPLVNKFNIWPPENSISFARVKKAPELLRIPARLNTPYGSCISCGWNFLRRNLSKFRDPLRPEYQRAIVTCIRSETIFVSLDFIIATPLSLIQSIPLTITYYPGLARAFLRSHSLSRLSLLTQVFRDSDKCRPFYVTGSRRPDKVENDYESSEEGLVRELALGLKRSIDAQTYVGGLRRKLIKVNAGGVCRQSSRLAELLQQRGSQNEEYEWYKQCMRKRIIAPYFRVVADSCRLLLKDLVDEVARLPKNHSRDIKMNWLRINENPSELIVYRWWWEDEESVRIVFEIKLEIEFQRIAMTSHARESVSFVTMNLALSPDFEIERSYRLYRVYFDATSRNCFLRAKAQRTRRARLLALKFWFYFDPANSVEFGESITNLRILQARERTRIL